jgi:predicted aspartyl protease
MKNTLIVPVLLLAILAPISAKSQTLTSLLAGQGLAGAKLERRFGNHLLVSGAINNKKAALMIDTGCPITLIDKNSAATFGLQVGSTKAQVGGAFATRWERYGASMVKSIAMGNCVVTNVPVALADESGMNDEVRRTGTGSHVAQSIRQQHVNGLLGVREMRKFGMIIDCTRQMLFVNPNGPSGSVSQRLAGFLAGKGFTRIPMRMNSNDHFDVPGAINGHATRFIVDTGAATTLVDRRTMAQAGIGFAPTGLGADAGDGTWERISSANVKELSVGDFVIPNAEVSVANVASDVLRTKAATEANSGLLGAEHLALNFAVIDVGGMALYLRHPDKR